MAAHVCPRLAALPVSEVVLDVHPRAGEAGIAHDEHHLERAVGEPLEKPGSHTTDTTQRAVIREPL